MKLLLSGEGPTDLGVNRAVAGGVEFVPGPMAHVVDRLLETHLGYSILRWHELGGDSVSYVGESELASLGKPGSPLFPGVKFGKGTALFTRNAQVLGLKATEEARGAAVPVVAVLFRDGDGTRSVPHTDWEQKVASIERGFELVKFNAGVPMVPRPKSEAWLLCALKSQAYAHCDALEEAPGNDASPRSLKGRLEALVGHEAPAAEQSDWVQSGRVDPQRIEMPSFRRFREALDGAYGNASRAA